MSGRNAIEMDGLQRYGFGPEVMKRIKVCSQCGERAEPAQHFCRACGARLPEGTLYDSYKRSHRACPVCDAVVPQSAGYCPHCGAKLEQAG